MIIVNRQGNVISGSVNGTPFNIPFSEGKYKVMLELADRAKNAKTIEELRFLVDEFKTLTRENYGDFVETRSPYVKVNKDNNKFYLQYNGVISSKAMPDKLGQRIVRAVERSVDILPLVKFWVRFLHNPNYTDSKAIRLVEYISATYTNPDQVKLLVNTKGLSEVMAQELSTVPQVSITQEGLLVGYKVSKEITDSYHNRQNSKLLSDKKQIVDINSGLIVYDPTKYDEDRIFEPVMQGQQGDAFYCGDYLGHIIKVGRIHYLPSWDMVNCNDNQTGVKGLHCGGLNYIRGYQNSNTVTHNIFIDPSHIGAIADVSDSSEGALRVKQYFVYSAFSGVNKQLYYSSNYAALTQKQYTKMISNAVNENYGTEKD